MNEIFNKLAKWLPKPGKPHAALERILDYLISVESRSEREWATRWCVGKGTASRTIRGAESLRLEMLNMANITHESRSTDPLGNPHSGALSGALGGAPGPPPLLPPSQTLPSSSPPPPLVKADESAEEGFEEEQKSQDLDVSMKLFPDEHQDIEDLFPDAFGDRPGRAFGLDHAFFSKLAAKRHGEAAGVAEWLTPYVAMAWFDGIWDRMRVHAPPPVKGRPQRTVEEQYRADNRRSVHGSIRTWWSRASLQELQALCDSPALVQQRLSPKQRKVLKRLEYLSAHPEEDRFRGKTTTCKVVSLGGTSP